ncbi:MAG: LysM peptidoglycan-binding domain-containing protein [Acidimicrobiales bacterium]
MVAITHPRTRPHDLTTFRRRRVATAGALVVALLVALVGLHAASSLLTAPEDTLRAGTTSTAASAVLVPDPGVYGSSGIDPPAGATYVVQPGDTLWSIARRLAPNVDITAAVDRLAELNGSSAIQIGQRLRLR